MHRFKPIKIISRGFTLIEMIVVIALIGIIAATVLAAINPIAQLQKSNDTHRKADLESLQHALELYYQDNGSYPPSSTNFQIMSGVNTVSWGSGWQPYMATVPKDPTINYNYVYFSAGGANANQSYYLYAHLQRKDDPQACNNTNTNCPNVPVNCANSAGGPCNYGVSSSNVAP